VPSLGLLYICCGARPPHLASRRHTETRRTTRWSS
jgi:hypothetical protein